MTSENPIAQNNPTPDASRESAVQASHSKPNIPPTPSVASLPPTQGHCRITCEAEKNWWDKVKPILEIIGIVLLAVYTAYTIKMYYANRKAAEAAESAANTAASTLKEIQSGSTDTRKLAGAAETQAQAAKTLANNMTTMVGQVGVSLDLQRRIAKEARGLPLMAIAFIELFHRDESRKVWGVGSVMNQGKTYADSVRVAVSIDILTSPPPKPTREFRDSDFRDTTPNRLEPQKVPPDFGNLPSGMLEMQRPLSAQQYAGYKTSESTAVYVWGTIRYKDFIGDIWHTTDFCTSYPTKDALGSPTAPDGRGYIDTKGNSKNCN